MISFSSLYWFLKQNIGIKLGKNLTAGGGGCLIMAMATGACLGGHFVSNRAFLCQTGLFCVEPCILLSNRAFLCRTSVIMLAKPPLKFGHEDIIPNLKCGDLWSGAPRIYLSYPTLSHVSKRGAMKVESVLKAYYLNDWDTYEYWLSSCVVLGWALNIIDRTFAVIFTWNNAIHHDFVP